MFEIKGCVGGNSSSVKVIVTIVGKSGSDFLTPRTLK